MKPRFSIIVPVYNVEEYLEKCLNSIVGQTYQNYEAIIVCDKSDDNSEKIVDKYIKKYPKFHKIYAESTGLSRARNLGAQKSLGDYILFLDGDDYYEDNLLKVLSNSIQDYPDIIRFQVQDVVNNTIIKHNELGFNTTNGIKAFDKIINYHYVENAWCYCYNAKYYSKNKFEFMNDCIAEDYGLLPLVIAKSKKVKSLDFIGYNYVIRNNSLMNENDYSKKIKKMEDMLLQANFLKKEIAKIANNTKFIIFINNSLIYYSTRLKYNDYKKYNKILKRDGCYKHLKANNIKSLIRNFLIKTNSYFFYNFVR